MLRLFDNYTEAVIVLTMLQRQNINCHIKNESISSRHPLLNQSIGGIKLMVHHSQVEKAWDMVEKAEKDYLKNIACPVCKAHALERVSITKKHSCRLAALASIILNGRSVEVARIYRCFQCGYDFKKLTGGG